MKTRTFSGLVTLRGLGLGRTGLSLSTRREKARSESGTNRGDSQSPSCGHITVELNLRAIAERRGAKVSIMGPQSCWLLTRLQASLATGLIIVSANRDIYGERRILRSLDMTERSESKKK